MTDPKAELKGCDLKKQTQFVVGQIDRILVITRVYGDLDDLRQRKNKANSNPNKANLSAYGRKSETGPAIRASQWQCVRITHEMENQTVDRGGSWRYGMV